MIISDVFHLRGPRLVAFACLAGFLLLSLLSLSGCYEPASTWSEKQGRYRPTDEVRREIINEEIDKRKRDRERERLERK